MGMVDKQWDFLRLLVKLVPKAEELGLKLTLGDAYRDPRLHGQLGEKKGYGSANSCHKVRLAQDFNLFVGNDYKGDTESHRVLGEYWESLDPRCRWGGRFNDANHYSFEHNGAK